MARMRWLTVVLPMCFLLILLVLEVQYLRRDLTGVQAIVLGFTISAIGIVIFSRSVFEVVERLLNTLRAKNEDLTRQTNQLEAVRAASLQVASHIDLGTVLQQIAESSRELVRARYAAIAIVRDGQLGQMLTAGMSDEERQRIIGEPQGLGLLGHVLRSGRPYRTSDVASDRLAHGFPPGHPHMRSFLGVPVITRGEVIGNIYLADKEDGDFTDEDERAVSMLALQAAIAIENARLFQEGREIAVLKERERIAMALHDGAIQALYGVGLRIESCIERVEMEPAQVREDLDRAIEDLNAIIRDFRSHIFDLRPHQIEGRSLKESCQDLLLDLAVNTLIATELAVAEPEADPDPTTALSMEQIRVLFRVVEDALEGIRLHAKARNVRLEMGRRDEKFWLRVMDDGVAWEERQEASSTASVHELVGAVHQLGGELTFASGPGGGTTVAAVVPLGTRMEGTQ